MIGAITALNMGVGTAIMATTMAGDVIHGTAIGTLIDASIGIVAGEIIGGVVSDWSAEGILTGMGIGFGGGAIIGGSVGAIQYTNAANSWLHGKEAMIDHFNRHGADVGAKNVIQYTKSAKSIIKNGTYLTQKNAYVISKVANKFYYVGVARNSSLITTYFTKTLIKTAMITLGLI